MAQVVTIRQSIVPGTPLPPYPNNTANSNVTPSGQSTIETDPPYFAQNVAVNVWQGICQAFLGLPHSNAIDTERLADTEGAIFHVSEGDVVRASALYLLHPVNQALWACNQVAQTYMCQSEATTNRVRSDITYYKNTATGRRAFAVVEFKKRGTINAAEFATAVRFNQAPTPVQVTNTVAVAVGLPNSTYYGGNSYILMKQASSYAVTHNMQYVALFNWDCLVLIKFSQIANGFCGDYCETTVIPAAQSNIMRQALLGFLAEAYNSV